MHGDIVCRNSVFCMAHPIRGSKKGNKRAMISYVTQEAATDDRLTPTALRLLIYLGGVNPHIGGWSNAHGLRFLALILPEQDNFFSAFQREFRYLSFAS